METRKLSTVATTRGWKFLADGKTVACRHGLLWETPQGYLQARVKTSSRRRALAGAVRMMPVGDTFPVPWTLLEVAVSLLGPIQKNEPADSPEGGQL